MNPTIERGLRAGAASTLLMFALAACGDDDKPSGDAGTDSGSMREDAGKADAAEEDEPDAAPFDDEDAGEEEDASEDAGEEDAGLTAEQLVARGQYVVDHVAACGDCHTPRGPTGPDLSQYLAGIDCFVDVDRSNDAFGCAATRNLTNHETGLANRSDDEIKDMFLRGLRPDGSSLHPFMPYFVLGNMSAQDADAVVAYLRTVPGVDHMVPPSQAPFVNEGEPAPTWPEALIPKPRADYPDQEAALRGRYLAGNIGICMECHTARNAMQQPLIDKAFQGGQTFGRDELGLPPVFPEVIYSRNLTPHETGIAGRTVESIVAALKDGVDKDNEPLCPPMPGGPMAAFGGLTDEDANDIANYLLSLEPGDNPIPEDCHVPMAPPAP